MASKSRKQTFRPEYTTKWPCIVPSKRDMFSARCEICSSDFNISHAGANAIQSHIKTKKHISMVESVEGCKDIGQMFQKTDYSSIRAETLMANFLVEHNVAFSAADHLSDLFRKMFPDSRIAAKFASRRTKTTAIARTLGQVTKDKIVCKLRDKPFSLSTDGSSDRGADEQLYPVVVRFYDEEAKRVVSALLEIATTKENSTGRNIFQLLDDTLSQCSIPWKNAICFGADNAAVMMGIHNGVAAFMRKQNPNIFVLGCPCHLLHLAAEKGAAELPVSPAETLTAIYYYLEKSSKRHKEFKEVQKLCCVQDHAILKHVCTRWLSMQKSLDRLLEQWDALKEYFRREAQTAGSCPPKKQKLGVGSSSVSAQKKQSMICQPQSSKKTGSQQNKLPGSSRGSSKVKSVVCQPQSSKKTGPPQNKLPGSSSGSGKVTSQARLFTVSSSERGQYLGQTTPQVVSGSKTAPARSSGKTFAGSTHGLKTSSANGRQMPTNERLGKQTVPGQVAVSNISKKSQSTSGKESSQGSTPSATKAVKRKAESSQIASDRPISTVPGQVAVSNTSTQKLKSKISAKKSQSTSGKESSQGSTPSATKAVKRKAESSQIASECSISKAAAIYDKLGKDRNKLYCLFLQHTIPLFNRVNLELQEEAPKIHLLLDILQELLHSLHLRFVKPEAILKATSVIKCEFKNREDQREDEDLIVGSKVREFISSGSLSDEDKSEFHSSVRKYFVTACNYINTKFPLQDDVLKHAMVANPTKRVDMTYSSVAYFVNRFQLEGIDKDALELEFASYQVDTLNGVSLGERADVVWAQISNMENRTTGTKKYPNLSKVMLTILTIEHSNATDERIFSLVRKNSTEFRASLKTATISDFLTQKVWNQAIGKDCRQMNFSDKLLEKCKKATVASNTTSHEMQPTSTK